MPTVRTAWVADKYDYWCSNVDDDLNGVYMCSQSTFANSQCVEVHAGKAWCFMRSLYVNSQAASGCVLREAFDIFRCCQPFAICENQLHPAHSGMDIITFNLATRWFMIDIFTEITRFLGAVEYMLGGIAFRISQNTIATCEIIRKAGNTRNACTTDEIETTIETTTIWEIFHGLVFLSKQSGSSIFSVRDKVTLLR